MMKDIKSDEQKLSIMYQIVSAKFYQNSTLMQKLKQTEGDIIIDSSLHDTYWGVCNGVGENHLGQILMSIRDSL